MCRDRCFENRLPTCVQRDKITYHSRRRPQPERRRSTVLCFSNVSRSCNSGQVLCFLCGIGDITVRSTIAPDHILRHLSSLTYGAPAFRLLCRLVFETTCIYVTLLRSCENIYQAAPGRSRTGLVFSPFVSLASILSPLSRPIRRLLSPRHSSLFTIALDTASRLPFPHVFALGLRLQFADQNPPRREAS